MTRAGRSNGNMTLEEVARRAGVSPITVSRALRRPDLLARDTLQHVLDHVRATGYVPDAAATSLASRHSNIVALIMPRLSNPANITIMQGISDGLEGSRLSLLVGASQSSAELEESILAAVLGWRPAAILLAGLRHTVRTRRLARAAGCPVVELIDIIGRPIDAAIGIRHRDATLAMTSHLARKGYAPLAYVHVELNSARFSRRRDGFLAGVARAGLADGAQVVTVSDVTANSGNEGAEKILALPTRPRAVLCATDMLAIGAMQLFLREGLRIPEDIAVAGFEDIELASVVYPSLTTVRVPLYRMGQLAAAHVLAKLSGMTRPRVLDVGFEIVERESA